MTVWGGAEVVVAVVVVVVVVSGARAGGRHGGRRRARGRRRRGARALDGRRRRHRSHRRAVVAEVGPREEPDGGQQHDDRDPPEADAAAGSGRVLRVGVGRGVGVVGRWHVGGWHHRGRRGTGPHRHDLGAVGIGVAGVDDAGGRRDLREPGHRHTEGRGDGRRGGRPVGGVLGQALLDDPAQVARHAVGQRRRRVVDLGQGRGDGRAGVERLAAGEHLLRDDPQGVEVAGAGGSTAERLLGREVLRRAQHLAGTRVRGAVDGPGDAEVGELHPPVGGDEDVGGLDVAVHDAGRVGRRERERRLADDAPHLAGRHRAAADDGGERVTLDELHDEVGGAVVLAVVVDRGDVLVRHPRAVPGLVAEPGGEGRVLGGVGPHHLDGDVAAQHRVRGAPDVTHPPGGDALGEGVAAAEGGAGFGVHRVSIAVVAGRACTGRDCTGRGFTG